MQHTLKLLSQFHFFLEDNNEKFNFLFITFAPSYRFLVLLMNFSEACHRHVSFPSLLRILFRACLSWWSQSGSNRRPSACKADALPAELWPLPLVVGLGGLEPPTPRLSSVCSNQLSYRPLISYSSVLSLLVNNVCERSDA
jgi:hypothetical protein